ncbi:FAD NAD(P)-binding domain-containing [Lecanosticta acicola]|uniref:FAD NAD(P)-binding domain-containing n=1 Tax=Lecanosticta acicola TaxID=111012 RepID=A0AAI8YTN5_9PEZI|nr:FAD NAD(P)-binding domain-containing [Lecanosticta acicola]
MAPYMSNPSSDGKALDPPKSSGIRVVIVGAGFAGLTAAIECSRKGHTCVVLDAVKEMKQLGDIISFGSNSGRIFQRWPGVPEKLAPICHNSQKLQYKMWTGEDLYTQWWGSEQENFGKRYNGHRGEIHKIVYDHAVSQGVEILLGQNVTEYFESDCEAGVIANGERIVGDVVLGADGVRSKARTLVLGYDDKPKPSGYAIYRAWMNSEELAKNELTRDLVIHGDTHTGWLGPDIHFLAASIKDGKEFSWVFTHKDERDVDEGWSEPGNHHDACRILEGWDPAVHAIVQMTPPEKLVDWKLVYRDPLPTWISSKGRIALIGDAAHPFLPTSIQGASQAMEDGACIAVCLQLSGKQHVSDALRAYERIRYERVRKTQKTGEQTRDQWHKADFENLKKNPEAIKLKRDPEVLNHDAEAHAYQMHAEVVDSLCN